MFTTPLMTRILLRMASRCWVELATSNAQLVARIARIIRELERAVAKPDEARALLGSKSSA